ncbi:MAG: fumarylacetoacetate hydrolase family protein [Pseudolysinimonas sp.]
MRYLGRCIDSDSGEFRVVVIGDDDVARAVAATSIGEVLSKARVDILTLLDGATEVVVPDRWVSPVDGRTEVWAAGVTYLRSRDARTEESEVPDVYTRVYLAERPELFFKSVSWKVVTGGDPIGIREDSELNVPEPEVAVLVTAFGEILGYTICNDVSSRSIEGENPLYLPQAKVYSRSCAVHHLVRVFEGDFDPNDLKIHGEIVRNGAILWQAAASTSQLNRTFADLVDWLYRCNDFPEGALLSTGTCLVPEMDVTLTEGDTVRISVSELGVLTNRVVAESVA